MTVALPFDVSMLPASMRAVNLPLRPAWLDSNDTSASNRVNFAAHRADHHVANCKTNFRVRLIEGPGHVEISVSGFVS